MSSKIITFARIMLTMLAWFFCCYQYYQDFDHPRFFNFGTGLTFVAALIVSVLSLVFDYSTYTLNKKITAFTPALFSLMCIGIYFGVKEYLLQRDRTPVVIRAHSNNSNFSIDFREDGTYKCGRHYFMSGADYERGTYSMKDSFIYLDRKNLQSFLRSDKLLMKTMMVPERIPEKKLLKMLFGEPKYDTVLKTFILQLNKSGDTIPLARRLTVI